MAAPRLLKPSAAAWKWRQDGGQGEYDGEALAAIGTGAERAPTAEVRFVRDGVHRNAAWCDADLAFANSTCYDRWLMGHIAALGSAHMRRGALLVTYSKPLPQVKLAAEGSARGARRGPDKSSTSSFEPCADAEWPWRVVEVLEHEASWGAVPVYIHRKVA